MTLSPTPCATPRATWTVDLGYDDPVGLSPREAQVLGLVAAGRPVGSVARGLLLPERVVESFLSTAMGLVGAADRRDALRWSLDHGLLVPAVVDLAGVTPLEPTPTPTGPAGDEVAA